MSPNAITSIVVNHLREVGYVVEDIYPKAYQAHTPDGQILAPVFDEAEAWALCYKHFYLPPTTTTSEDEPTE
jgi:hypothetical protein